ncbi:MAG: HAMP domain-containing histidine kinase [Deltaproteobacteria bacterium]|nr:HAMP domain-containing histidine kinase [Nannocystaceae bacterium]
MLTFALLVGWIYVIVRSHEVPQQWAAGNVWLLFAGIVSFLAIIAVLVLFSVFLAREILEVRRRTTFIDSVTHELRSPLASLKLCLETMGRAGLDSDQRDHLHEMMRDDVERLSAFIEDILETTRVEHGGKGRAVARIELAGLVERCIEMVMRRYHFDPEIIRVDIQPHLSIVSDRAALEVVIKNLLDNAIKYSDPPPQVVVHAVEEAGVIRLSVSDRGIGIPKRDLKRIFDRFYRVDEEAVRARRGTGLGLFVVQALVRAIGGRLTAHSDGVGQGTRMTVIVRNRSDEKLSAPAVDTGRTAST